jgi:hypothetical protein
MFGTKIQIPRSVHCALSKHIEKQILLTQLLFVITAKVLEE